MGVPQALRRAREARRLTQGQLGLRIGYGDSMVSAVENQGRNIAPDVALAAASLLDDPELYVALAEEASGWFRSSWTARGWI